MFQSPNIQINTNLKLNLSQRASLSAVSNEDRDDHFNRVVVQGQTAQLSSSKKKKQKYFDLPFNEGSEAEQILLQQLSEGSSSPDKILNHPDVLAQLQQQELVGTDKNLQRMIKNLESLKNMNFVGGTERLNNLIEHMSKQSQRKKRMRSLQQSRYDRLNEQRMQEANDLSYNDSGLHVQSIEHQAKLSQWNQHQHSKSKSIKPETFEQIQEALANKSGQAASSQGMLGNASSKIRVNTECLREDFEEIKRKNNIHVVISVPDSPVKVKKQSLAIKNMSGLHDQDEEVLDMAQRTQGMASLKHVDSVQQLGIAERHESEGSQLTNHAAAKTAGRLRDGGVESVMLGDRSQHPSKLQRSKGDKKVFEDFTNQYKLRPEDLQATGSKQLRGRNMSLQLNTQMDFPSLPQSAKHETHKSALKLPEVGPKFSIERMATKRDVTDGSLSPTQSRAGIRVAKYTNEKRQLGPITSPQTVSNMGLINDTDLPEPMSRTKHRQQILLQEASSIHNEPSHEQSSLSASARKAQMKRPSVANMIMKPTLAAFNSKYSSKKSLPMLSDIVKDDTAGTSTTMAGKTHMGEAMNFDGFVMKGRHFSKDSVTNKIKLKRGISPQMGALGQVITQKPLKIRMQNERQLRGIDSLRTMIVSEPKNGPLAGLVSPNSQAGPKALGVSRMLGYDTHDAIDGHDMSKTSSIQRLFHSPSISTVKAGSNLAQMNTSPSMNNISARMIFPPQSSFEPGTNVSSALEVNVSTSMLQQTGEKSNKDQLMAIFDKRMHELGLQNLVLGNIMFKGTANPAAASRNGLGQVEGDIQSFQAMVAEQALQGKPGGHLGEPRKESGADTKLTRMSRSPSAQSPLDTMQQISGSHKKALNVADQARQERREKSTNIMKHQKAIALIEQVENQIRQKRGSMKADLSIEQKKIGEQPTLKVVAGGAATGSSQRQVSVTMETYDFKQFNNSDADSDFADQKTLRAIQGEVKQEPGAASVEVKQRRDPNEPIDPFKNTKYEQLVSLPGQTEHDKTYERNPDGTVKYTKEQKEMIKERGIQADKRVSEKLKFAGDMQNMQDQTQLLIDVNSLEQTKPTPLTDLLDRNQTNMLYKEDFEVKVTMMNKRLQPELDSANKALNLNPDLFKPRKTPEQLAEDAIQEGKEWRDNYRIKQEQKRVKAISVTDMMNVTANATMTNTKTNSFKRQTHASRMPEIEESAEIPVEVTESGQDLERSSPKHRHMMAAWKKRKIKQEILRRSVDKKARDKRKEGDEQEEEDSLMQEYGDEIDLEKPDTPLETFEQRKKRETLEEYRELARKPAKERRKIMMNRNLEKQLKDPEEEKREKLQFDFLNKVNWDEDFPVSTINKLIIKKMKEFEAKNNREFTDSKMAHMFAQDEMINGLCLLRCLKTESLGKSELHSHEELMTNQTSQNILKAAKAVREFTFGQQKSADDDDDPAQGLIKYLGDREPSLEREPMAASFYAHQQDTTESTVVPVAKPPTHDSRNNTNESPYQSQVGSPSVRTPTSPIKLKMVKRTSADCQVGTMSQPHNRQDVFNSMIFQSVLSKILDSDVVGKNMASGLAISKKITEKYDKNIVGVKGGDHKHEELTQRLKDAVDRKEKLLAAMDKAKDDYDEAEERRKVEVRKTMLKAMEERLAREAKGIKSKKAETPVELPPEIEKPNYQEMLKGVNEATNEIASLTWRLKAKQKENAMDYARLDGGEQAVQLFARKINLQNEFFQMAKLAETPRVISTFQNNPILHYFNGCVKEQAVILPILNRIVAKGLILINYKLNMGVCSAIGEAFSGNPKLLTSICLDNNGILDAEAAKIFQGLRKLDHVRSITYRRNEFGLESLAALEPLLARRKPRNLEELRLVSCKMNAATSNGLTEALLNASSLQRLSLANVSLSAAAFDNFLYYVRSAQRQLRELDISNNGFRASQMLELMEILSENRKLEIVDLSWNTLQPTELSAAPSALEGTEYAANMTKAMKKQIERTQGQFSTMAQEAMLAGKAEHWRNAHLKQLKDDDYSRVLERMANDSAIGSMQTGPILEPIKQEEFNKWEVKPVAETPADDADNMDGEAGEDQDGEGEAQEGDDGTPAGKGDDASGGGKKKKKDEDAPRKPKTLADALSRERELMFQQMAKDLKICLTRFIKYNQQLLRLNLAHTGLGVDIVRRIGISMNKARALCSMSLTGNPGANDAVIAFIQGRINCKQKRFGTDAYSSREYISIDFDVTNDPVTKRSQAATIHKESTADIASKHEHMGVHGRRHLIQDNLKLQRIKRSLQASDNRAQLNAEQENKLDICRVLGHQWDMPGSGQWEIFNNFYDPSERCWIADSWVHTLIFWTPTIGNINSEWARPEHSTYRRKIMSQVLQAYPKLEPIHLRGDANKFSRRQKKDWQLHLWYHDDENRPVICCEQNKWRPVRMLRIEEYCQSLESETTRAGLDFFDKLRKMGRINPNESHKDFERLDEDDKRSFIKQKQELLESHQKYWFETVAKEIRYKKPFMVNGEYLKNLQPLADEPLYVYPTFMRPGKQNYIVIQSEDLANQDETVPLPLDEDCYFVHKTIAENRVEDIPIFTKPLKTARKERKFKHEKSMWKPWRPDTADTYEACLQHDLQYAKLARFVKPNDTEIPKVHEVLRKNFKLIVDIYHYLISKSQYPAIREFEYADWVRSIKAIDDKMDNSAVERDFKATNFQPDEVKIDGLTNPGNALCRFEFIEIICRMAKSRFEEKGKAWSHSEALEKLIRDHMYGQNSADPWQGFRDKQLWTLQVCDTLEPNLEGLQEVYTSYQTSRKPFMDVNDARDLLTKKTNLLTMEKYATYCYGMSKMTNVRETTDHRRYNQMQFIEFCEMIGRVAHFKYKDDAEMSKVELHTKIEYILDEVLGAFNIQRIEPEVKVLDESESDDEY